MSNRVLHGIGQSRSGRGWNRIYFGVFTAVVAVLLSNPVASQSDSGTAAGSSPQSGDAQAQSGSAQPSGSAPGQAPALTGIFKASAQDAKTQGQTQSATSQALPSGANPQDQDSDQDCYVPTTDQRTITTSPGDATPSDTAPRDNNPGDTSPSNASPGNAPAFDETEQGMTQQGMAEQSGTQQRRAQQSGTQQSRAQQSGTQGTQQDRTQQSNAQKSRARLLPCPYRAVRSITDLLTQIPSKGARPERFGSEIFLFGTGNANELPIDLPVGPDYVLGPGDNVAVNMWGGHSERLSLTIDRQGQIVLPEAGSITIDGLTIAQAQSAIQKALSTQFEGEHVEISLGRLRTVRVYVVGDVQRPGAYDVSALSTPLSALFAAGGPTSRGSLRILRQYRGDKMIREIDLYDFLLHGIRSYDDRLQPGDTIMVPAVGSQVTVEGMVHHPAIYELNGEKTLNQVLDLAGGVSAVASLKQINIERIVAHESRTMVSLDLPDDAQGVKEKLAEFKVQGGDDVVVAQILPYNQQAVYLQGHVYRPGKYPYKDGMTINDLVHSYQDLLPEPSDHAELIRLQPPDFRPETITLNLPEVLIGNNPIALRPFDVLRIFGRYEIDSPTVSIEGEVLRPGKYPMSQGLTVAGLVRMAGGFKRSAFREEADLTSYTVVDGKKVSLNHSTIEIQKALDGDKSADSTLQPGDVVSIRKISGWDDIGASVTLIGEVAHPGVYGIQPGEHLSTLLKRAGGFRDEAYPAGAVLQRVRVREVGEEARQEIIRRLETTPITFTAGVLSAQEQQETQQSIQLQRDQVLESLRNHPATGRLVINITKDIGKWENTSEDIELSPGDQLTIPKRQSFVLVSGQVYNQAAITYVPGKDGSWYLRQAGGATSTADKGGIFVIRANGAVIGHASSFLTGNSLNVRMRPGDVIIVPERGIGSQTFKNLIAAAQLMSAAVLPLALSGAL